MLTEDDVVEAVCRHLGRVGYRIDQRCTTNDRGVDIVAAHPSGVTLRVEAKGETSNHPESNRFGKPFSSSQVSDHVANALYAAAATLGAHSSDKDRVGMAFPDTRLHREYVRRVERATQTLRIVVFWVDTHLSVSVEPAGWTDGPTIPV
jgi:hypothetical protein